ncbi:MAG: hypothetical protein A2Y17_03885 [Clostridiales bacterium GWF2_38_85]|nr:MAG: hypothetical protein A2Y17_03885 [Clostridiales bacterium GWF2_38_85]
MIKEVVITAKTTDMAVDEGAVQLGLPKEKVKFEIIEEPKKGILGIGAANAKVRVFYELTPADLAEDFLKTLFKNMNLNVRLERIDISDEEVTLKGSGENLGILIGRHGDVLDSIQYLTMLAANKEGKGFYRINVDIENYREKRVEALKVLAKRMADKVLRYRKNFTLEPMSPYERRIIHSEIQNFKGVTTYSIGQDDERKIVVAIDRASKVDKAQ